MGKINFFLWQASSVVSALLLLNGKISHSTFIVPINITPTSVCQIDGKCKYAQAIRAVKRIVWDEVRLLLLLCV
jgi:hypothetical protein